MRVALVQFDIAWESVEENHRRVSARLEEAAAGGARLAILPEMFCTGFSMDAARIAQPPHGPTESFLKGRARDLGLWIIGSIPEAAEPAPRNTALLVSPDGDVERYSKIHPFSYAGEHRHYAPGDRIVTVEIGGVRVTPFICYDLRFPEPFRFAAADTDLFVVVANWPESRGSHWRVLLRARAIENLAYVAGVNRVGDGGKLHYAGDSALIDPLGQTVVEAGDTEAVLIGDVETARVREGRERFPVLADVRPAAYRRSSGP
ncbi:MAG: carbon-nitrogen family hydrolase [Thermoanaerobaculia bacterium]